MSETKEKQEYMTFMGYKVKEMTRDGLLEVIKYQDWEIKSLKEGQITEPPEIDIEVVAEIEPDITRKEVVNIQPGDVIAMSTERPLNEREYDYIVESMKTTFPETKCIILDNAMTMEIYRERKEDKGVRLL